MYLFIQVMCLILAVILASIYTWRIITKQNIPMRYRLAYTVIFAIINGIMQFWILVALFVLLSIINAIAVGAEMGKAEAEKSQQTQDHPTIRLK